MPIISRAISTYLTTYFMLLIVLLIYFHAIWGYGVESFNAYIGGLMLPFIFSSGNVYLSNEFIIIVGVFSSIMVNPSSHWILFYTV